MLARATQLISNAKDRARFRGIFRKFRNFTMIPEDVYTANLALAMRVRTVPGAIVECGTWKGGMVAGLADILGPEREYFLFDSYEGLPPAKEIDGEVALAWQRNTTSPSYYDNCRGSEEEARRAMSMSAAKHYTIHKGWFEDTLPKADLGPIALLRMDADWYDSTKQILDNFGARVVPGGLIIADDYYAYEGCAVAVNEYAAAEKRMIRQYSLGEVCYIIA